TWYWFLRGRLSEARRALDAAAASPAGDPARRARAAAWRIGFALLQGESIAPGEIRAALAGDTDGRAAWFTASAVIERSDLALAAQLLPTTYEDPWTEAAVLSSRAKLAHATGDVAT